MLLPILLVLGASADGWVSMPGVESATCGSAALANALHVLRPQLKLHAGDGPTSNLQIRLGRDGDHYALQLRGPELSIDRAFPDRGGCEEAVRTAALIVDGALDQISSRGAAPGIDTLSAPKPPPPLEAAFALGAGVEQGLLLDLGAAPTAVAELQFHFGLLEFGLSGDFVPSAASSSKSVPWSWYALGGSGEITIGVAPRVGPGRFFADAAAGLTFVTASVRDKGLTLFHLEPATDGDAFAGLRAGYTLDLPRRVFISVGVEERYTFSQAGFDVVGVTGASVSTRVWTVVGSLVLGWRFL